MSRSTAFAARILETSASAYAGAASSLLLKRHPEISERYAPSALRDWKSSLQQRILELSAALGAEEPELFAVGILWEGTALRARDLDVLDLRSGLTCLQAVFMEELPEPAGKIAIDYLASAIQRLDEAPPEEHTLKASDPQGRLTLLYLEASLEGNSRQAIQLLVDAVNQGMDIHQAYEILLSAQREVGRLWHLGELDVAEEHVVTATTERATAALIQTVGCKPSNGNIVVTAAVSGNRHGLAVRMLADLFELAGWRSICLGPNVPVADLAKAAIHFDADLLALSVTLPTQIKAARQSIKALRELPGQHPKILIGGKVLNEAPELWRRLGADGCIGKVSAAVGLGQQLMDLDP